jgi:hypothetical protein
MVTPNKRMAERPQFEMTQIEWLKIKRRKIPGIRPGFTVGFVQFF